MMGEIKMFGGNFAPKDWAFCNGQLIPISQNQALFAILGTIWGGDGRTNFALPDLRGRVPVGVGRGIGLTEVFQGRMIGTETQALSIPQMPQHNHEATFQPTGGGGGTGTPISVDVTIDVANTGGNLSDPTDNILAVGKSGLSTLNNYEAASAKTGTLGGVNVAATGGGGITGGTVTVEQTGGNQSFSVMQPAIGIQFIICTNGIFPSRN